jgi:hypothetical protein
MKPIHTSPSPNQTTTSDLSTQHSKTPFSPPLPNNLKPDAMRVQILVEKFFGAQKSMLDHAASSSSNFLPQIALEVLPSRIFSPSPKTDRLHIPVTGKGLGGGKKEEQIAALKKEIDGYNSEISIKQDKINDIVERHAMVDPDGPDAKGYNAVHAKLDKEVIALNVKRAVAEAKLKNLNKGASSSQG